MRDEDSLIILGEIKGELSSLRAALEKKVDDHEHRLVSVEHKWWMGTGAFGVILSIMGSMLYKLHVGF